MFFLDRFREIVLYFIEVFGYLLKIQPILQNSLGFIIDKNYFAV